MDARACPMPEWKKMMKKKFVEQVSNPENLDSLTEQIINGMIDKEILRIIFDVHRTAKTSNALEHAEVDESNLFTVPENNDNVVLGHDYDLSSVMVCPRCLEISCAAKFTKHFVDCFNEGRNRSLKAKLKISNIYSKNSYAEMSDDEDDKVKGRSKRGKKRKVNNKKKNQAKKNNAKRPKPPPKKKVA